MKSLELAKPLASIFDPSKKVHAKLADRVIPFLSYMIDASKERGHFSASAKYLRTKFNHHQSALGQALFDSLLVVESESYGNFSANSWTRKYSVNESNLTKLIEIHVAHKFSKMDRVEQDELKAKLNKSRHLRPLLCKFFPKLAEDELSIGSQSEASTKAVSCIDFSSDRSAKFETIRALDVAITYHSELLGRRPFVYTDKSHRLWHDLQRVKSELKADVFGSRLPFNYDISTAALRILFYKAKAIDKHFDVTAYPSVVDYIDNKSKVRNEVAARFGISVAQAKKIFSYLNNNGVLTTSPKRGLWQITQSNQITQAIESDRQIRAYALEVKRLWRKLHSLTNHAVAMTALRDGKVSTKDLLGTTHLIFDGEFTAKQDRYMLYFKGEREVLDVMREYMEGKGAHLFLEHDGFRSSIKLDQVEQDELEDLIASRTDVIVKLELEETEQ